MRLLDMFIVCVCVRVSAAYASDYDIIESCAGHVIFIELI